MTRTTGWSVSQDDMDMGSDRTMVVADCINLVKVESTDQVPIVCVHGDMGT